MSEEREKLEQAVNARLDERDYAEAATLILRGYGAELYGFLVARTRDENAATEAFSMFTEDLWRGLPSFAGRSTVRVWAYTLARHAAIRYQAAPHRARRRNIPLSADRVLSKLEQRARTETAPFLKTEFKTRIAELRARLTEDERTLLVLRLDRGLEWTEVARVFADVEQGGDGDIASEAARLRKRFQLIKAKIRRWAASAGLTDDG